MKPKLKFKCNGEILEISRDNGLTWDYVVDCCESLYSTFRAITDACDIEYDMIEEDD